MTKAIAVPKSLTIASWGGAYGKAQARAIFEPFAKQAGIKINEIRHGGAGRELSIDADVVDVGSQTLAKACSAGDLMPLDDITLAPAPGTTAIKDDLIDGARVKCGIGSMAWSHVILVRSQAFKKSRIPSALIDIFDLRRYPGKRVFVKSPRYLLEIALMAEGITPDEVYEALATTEGLDHALAKLEAMRAHIIWVDKPSDAYKLLQSGKAAIASGFSGRAFAMSVADPKLRTIWDGQIYDVEYWAIPKSAKNKAGAKRFLTFATAPKRLARNARYFPYGPMRKSAVQMTGKHDVLGIDLEPFLPTSPQNLRSALRFNASWWVANGARVKARTDPWFAKMTRTKARGKDKRASAGGPKKR